MHEARRPPTRRHTWGDVIRFPRWTAGSTIGLALCAVTEVTLVSWWAATGVGIVFIGLQGLLILLVCVVLLVMRYRRFRENYEQAIAANAVLADRARMSDELHDSLGHQLSLIALKVGSLQVRATGSLQEQAVDVRRDVELAVEKLHRALRAARDEDAAERIDEMIDRLTASGAAIRQRGVPPEQLPPAAQPTAHMVIREALTNAIRHAPDQPITIEHRVRLTTVEIEIRNSMPPNRDQQRAPLASGTGLDALERRVTSMGGELATASDNGHFLLIARFPKHPRPAPSLASEFVRPRRSPLWQTLRSALLPAAVVVVAILGFYTWSVHDSTMEDRDFAELRVGMSFSDAVRLLPDRQAPVRLVPSPEHDRTWTCRSYTDGNFPLGLAVFEVCFHDDSVVMLTDLRSQSWL